MNLGLCITRNVFKRIQYGIQILTGTEDNIEK